MRVSAGAGGAADADVAGEGVGVVEVACADRVVGSSEQPVAVVQTRKAAVMNPVRIRKTSLSSRRCLRAKTRRAAGEYPPVEAAPMTAAARAHRLRLEGVRAPTDFSDSCRRSGVFAVGLALLCAVVVSSAPVGRAEAVPREPIDLARYARLLAQHTRVVESLAGTAVDYAALARSRDLDALVVQLKAAKPSKLGHNARLAFWINAYNLLTLDLVRRHYPIEGIKDIGSFFSPVWRKPLGEIEGVEITLDRIEHEILRKEGEPRIHAAIVCASQSCPALLRRPFRARTLDADLEEAMRRFLASKRKGVAIDRAAKSVRVSKIFNWFEEDFADRGGVRAVIAAHLPPADAKWLRGPGRQAPISYFDYDWALNDR